MITLDVCLEMVLPGLSLAEKAKRVSTAGFNAVEIWFPDFDCEKGAFRDRDLDTFAQTCRDSNLFINNIVLNSPDGGIGGALVKKEDHVGYLKRLRDLLPILEKLGCSRMITCTGNTIPDIDEGEQRQNVIDVLREGAGIAAEAKVTLLLEPLNIHVDHAGYFLDSFKEGVEIARAVGSPNLRVLYDVYHMQIMEGNVCDTIAQNIEWIGHFHSAGVPGRHELDGGELNYRRILRAVHDAGYDGCFGLEFSPALADHHASLRTQYKHLKSAGDFVR